MRLTTEAITAARKAANDFGFAINDTVAAHILGAGVAVLTGEDVIADMDGVERDRAINALAAEVKSLREKQNEIIDFVNERLRREQVVPQSKPDYRPEGV